MKGQTCTCPPVAYPSFGRQVLVGTTTLLTVYGIVWMLGRLFKGPAAPPAPPPAGS